MRYLYSLILGSCVVMAGAVAAESQQVQREVEEWRAGRLARLTSETGWLTLIGLYWLKPGDNSFGSGEANALVLRHAAMPAALGSFVVQGGKVRFQAVEGAGVTWEGKPVTSLELASDATGTPTVLSVGSVQFFIIERSGKLGVRVRDTQHPLRRSFAGLEYFPISADWALDAKFAPYRPARKVKIVNILGLVEEFDSPGALVFQKDGREYRLDSVLETAGAEELFVMFADATTARETYGAGRFLYTSMPEHGRVKLDFNRAYNPPCAFNEFATCPLPPRQNRLPLRIDAGEKKYAGAH